MKTASSPPRRFFPFLLGAIVIALICSSCGRNEQVPASVVRWPELLHFDEVLREVEALVADSGTQKTLEKRVTLLNAGWAVAPATTPENVPDREKVRALLGDLVSKLNGLAVSSLPPVELSELIQGTRPILDELFEVSRVKRP